MPARTAAAAWLTRSVLRRAATVPCVRPPRASALPADRTRPLTAGERRCSWKFPALSAALVAPLAPCGPRPSRALHACDMTSASANASEDMTQRMVWVDLEMTGLNIEKDQIIEMACIITDPDLNIVAEGPNLIVNQSDELLDGMSEWCKEHHGKSGLTQAVRDSRISLQQAEYEFLSFVRQHTPPGHCPLAGNSVHADKKFLDKYMPQLMRHLHYRIIDVSTVKELCRRWFPEEYKLAPQKKASHRALDDIRESIKELQFYKTNVFKAQAEEKKRKIVENGENGKCVR
ncbi:oligoribonuclease, mitochondrial-like [Scleropages formosus]|uniref:Oligoribonuclease, mitochondrial n=1 Tax=Scleropages formosus TaxID=113540 RepID=A0A0P7WQW2_SCLFO|nr:oligoribonuclease, mitochondrial [Scleropages formosus]KPP64068.1 oligoribonuclease, mitochondrial-like [Scleropages formosus]